MRTLYLIPARGGSKGLPGKNVRPLLGKPLMAWTIEAALKASERMPGRVVVSTDDASIAQVAKDHGAEVPFMRPNELAMDHVSHVDVVLHALHWAKEAGEHFDLVCMLEPTSPQRDAHDVVKAIEQLLSTPGAEAMVGLADSGSAHPAFLAAMDEHRFIRPLQGDRFVFKRRQEVGNVYYFEGSLYISRVASFIERKSFYHDRTLGYEMPKWKAFEVDDITDFTIIEALMKARQEGTIPEQ